MLRARYRTAALAQRGRLAHRRRDNERVAQRHAVESGEELDARRQVGVDERVRRHLDDVVRQRVFRRRRNRKVP
eukprot:3673763-Prymnesium_polylepis.1